MRSVTPIVTWPYCRRLERKKDMFKPFDKVLVRDLDSQKWVVSFFSHIDEANSYPYCTVNGACFAQCIPYEGNENLVGDTGEPKSTWVPIHGRLVAVSDYGVTWHLRVFDRQDEYNRYFCYENDGKTTAWTYCKPAEECREEELSTTDDSAHQKTPKPKEKKWKPRFGELVAVSNNIEHHGYILAVFKNFYNGKYLCEHITGCEPPLPLWAKAWTYCKPAKECFSFFCDND